MTDIHERDEPSVKMRHYLAEVYRLHDRGGDHEYVSTSALAELLDVSAPAVNRMVTKLGELGMLVHEPYKGIVLTETGRQEALKELRRHRIAEAFLVNVMGFGWHEVHQEAHDLATNLSEMLTTRMEEMAGYPKRCPHGEPIPNADGVIENLNDLLLADAPDNQLLEVTRVRTREPDRLEYLAALGLIPGAQLTLIHRAPFNGPMQLKLKEEYRIIGHNLAELVRVQLTS